MRKFLFSFVLASVLFTACDKKTVTPPLTTNTPIFKASITFDGNTTDFIAGENNCILTTSTAVNFNVNRSLALFSMGNDELLFTFNDGNFKDNLSFLEKLKSVSADGIKFSSFKPSDYTFSVQTLKQMLGNNVELYINNEHITSANYTFPSSGIYTVEVHKTIDGMLYKVVNECFVGFKNPYGNLTFDYNATTQLLTASITNETTEKLSVKWLLDNNLVSENNTLSLTEDSTGVKKIKAVVTYQGVTKTFEGLVDFNQLSNGIADIKQYGNLFENENSSDDLRLNIQFTKDNQIWKISPDNTTKLNVFKIEFYKKINNKNIYLLEGEVSNLIFKNLITNELKSGSIKINVGFEVPY